MHIEIVKHLIKGIEVVVVDFDGRASRTFSYPTLEIARKAAKTWTAAHGDCEVCDLSGLKE
jgi:hypothetical protein